jgi:hypothetical protein
MGGIFTVRITEAAGEIHDLRYRLIWSARLDGRLLGKGHALSEYQALERAQECVDPETIDDLRIEYRGSDWSRDLPDKNQEV